MRPLLLAALFLAAVSSIALSQCGPRGCTAPRQIAPAPAVEIFQWKRSADDPGRAYLYQGNRQLGGFDADSQVYRPLIDIASGLWGQPQAPPIAPPADLVRSSPANTDDARAKTLQAWELGGVVQGEICRHPRQTINGRVVSFEDAAAAIGGNLPDDSGKLYLSIFARDPAKRAAVVADLKANPALWKWVTERCHLWAGAAATPGHFLELDRQGQPLHAIDGEPTICLQRPDGVEIWHDAGYTEGPASLESMRKRDPNYRPEDSPGPRQPGVDLSQTEQLALLLGGLAACFYFFRSPETKEPAP